MILRRVPENPVLRMGETFQIPGTDSLLWRDGEPLLPETLYKATSLDKGGGLQFRLVGAARIRETDGHGVELDASRGAACACLAGS